MMNKKRPRKYVSRLSDRLLAEMPPVEDLQAVTKMTLSARLADLITARGWSKGEFAERVNKNPSEITKWLGGTHNFTIDTLAEIALALNIPVSDLFVTNRVHVLNKSQVNVSVTDVRPGIRYLTPFGRTAVGFPGIYQEGLRDIMQPFTPRLQA